MKYLGIIILILCAIVMMIAYVMGWSDNNLVMGGMMCLMIVSLVMHIVLNRIYQ